MWVASEPGPPGRDDLYGMVTAAEGAKMMEPFVGPESKLYFKVLDHDDIASVIDDFAAAVVRAREAGVDGCELHAGHGYLIDGFLSPAKNHRTDEYGGSVEHRARFLVEILQECRRRVGDDFALWCRLNSTENRADGTTLDDCISVARLAVAAGADAVHASAYHDPASATGPTDSYAPQVPGLLIESAHAVSDAIDAPVIAVGRITPDAADAAIADGAFDFVSMARMILAEPELPNLLAAGRPEEIRPCVYHYRCIGNIFVRGQVRCAANGSVGREDELVIGQAASPRSVRVVGGGPSGMEGARVAALGGHSVTLVDAAARLGGRWAYAAATSDVNADLLRWLEHQLELQGVTVRVGERFDVDAVVAEGADTVVVATGARWGRTVLTGADLPHVHAVDDLDGWLLDGESVGDDVVVLGGDLPGLGIAERAAREGARVTVLEPSDVFGLHLGLPGRWRRVHDLRATGIVLAGGADVVEITPREVRWRDLDGDHATGTDAVFTTLDVQPDTALADDLRARGVDVAVVGDAGVGAGRLEHAMRTALETAVALSPSATTTDSSCSSGVDGTRRGSVVTLGTLTSWRTTRSSPTASVSCCRMSATSPRSACSVGSRSWSAGRCQ
jgi:2,4-dienoyl-CoA reductase (NADPH2)